MGEDRFFPQGEELFLSSLHESLTLTSRDNYDVSLHHSIDKIWNNGIVE
jgi:hypothetical protein